MEARSETDQDALLCTDKNGKSGRRGEIYTNNVYLEAVVAKEKKGPHGINPGKDGDG